MIKVTRRDGESSDRLLKRFSSHVKSKRMPQKFRALRYFAPTPTKRKVRAGAVARERYRAIAKQKQYQG